ncbi:S9 family peptidase [uncultured Paraglaciecola sp.]|jgi:dipeptidyl aminopeptidase/acylaminoacyl peptidase|uniref:alpha/beta hydrolase family protein n=1 Tax=uncultured Paraglaciecola sp. TaxID=1765024 RepID=UPI0025D6FA5D|nr:S9 family peptidase [uncultured Paraglaciecola sp.]
MSHTTAAYGTWESPITAASIFEVSDNVSYLTVENNQLYFVESKASANGKNVLFKLNESNTAIQLTSSKVSVRSRVHEYGGRPYLVTGEDIYYSEFTDQKIYRISQNGTPQAITSPGLRYMECIADQKNNRLICVREDHRGIGEPINTLVAINVHEANKETILFEGTDFVSAPHLSPNGKSVAFVTWLHPNMPWDDTQLRVINFSEEGLIECVVEVPQDGNVSIKHPHYSKNGMLYFIADYEDWWTLYRIENPSEKQKKPQKVLDKKIEINSYSIENDDYAIIAYSEQGSVHIARVNLVTGEMINIGDVFSSADSISVASDTVYFRASTPSSGNAIYKLTDNNYEKIYQPNGPEIEKSFLSLPQSVKFPTGIDEIAYGFYYPPQNSNFTGAKDTSPPLIVKVHGGPVSATDSSLNPGIQFWTSRGFAVFDVNHRGSTGYGRTFRKKLYPNWGIVDVEDVSNGVKWLASEGFIDADKVAIRGGSAGGYTTLAALAFQNVFKAGTSYYGISDLGILARDTHKFESRYLDQLIGPYPEMKSVYDRRSPINSVENITAPLLLLQGLDDKVVPPNQSELIFNALKDNSIDTAYITFEGEGHGFRQPANNIKALNSELSFYGQVFGFVPAGNIEEVQLTRCGSE